MTKRKTAPKRKTSPVSPPTERLPAGLLLMDTVLTWLGGVSKCTLTRLIRDNGFPPGGSLRGRKVWRAETVARWLMTRFPDAGDAKRMALL